MSSEQLAFFVLSASVLLTGCGQTHDYKAKNLCKGHGGVQRYESRNDFTGARETFICADGTVIQP